MELQYFLNKEEAIDHGLIDKAILKSCPETMNYLVISIVVAPIIWIFYCFRSIIFETIKDKEGVIFMLILIIWSSMIVIYSWIESIQQSRVKNLIRENLSEKIAVSVTESITNKRVIKHSTGSNYSLGYCYVEKEYFDNLPNQLSTRKHMVSILIPKKFWYVFDNHFEYSEFYIKTEILIHSEWVDTASLPKPAIIHPVSVDWGGAI